MIRKKQLLSWGFLLVILTLSLVAMGLFTINRHTPVPSSWGAAGGARDGLEEWTAVFILGMLMPLTSSIFGLLVLKRDSHNRIGRLLCLLGGVTVLYGLANEYTVYGYFTSSAAGQLHIWSAWLVDWLWLVLFSVLIHILAIFPTGRMLLGAWRWLIPSSVVLFVGPMFLGVSSESHMSSAYGISNPLQIRALAPFYDVFMTFGVVFIVVSILLVFAAVLIRFHRQSGMQRQQIKWLLASAGLMAVMVVVGLTLGYGFGIVQGQLLVNISLLSPLVGVGIAILRYRLYDVDLIVRRTLQYSILTGLLSLVYFGGVALLQTMLTADRGPSTAGDPVSGLSSTIIVLTTLVIAALFNPLRRRIQDFIDRRFYRQKYDAERALADFAAAARSETDLEQLSQHLAETVQDTLQPDGLELWLRSLERRS